MEWWTILIFGGVVWWLWPKLFGNDPPVPTSPPRLSSLEDLRATIEPPSPTAAAAFSAMERVRDRMIEVGASREELDQLTALAPILLRVPAAEEVAS